jgi:hypothetical protein
MTIKEKEEVRLQQQNHITLATEIAKTVVIEHGAVSIPDHVYFDLGSRHASLEKETIQAVHKWDGAYYPAAVRAVGEHALTLMNADSGLDEVNATVGCDNHHLTVLTQRSRTYPGNNGADPTVKFGVTTVKLETGFSSGAMKGAREDIKTMAAGLWGEDK